MRWAAGALVAAMAALLVYSLRADGLTQDEPLYIAAGRAHLAGDFRPNPSQPPVAKLLAGLGTADLPLALPERVPGEDDRRWAFRVVHEANAGLPVASHARRTAVAVTLALALLVAGWAARTHGPAAGLAALALTAFHTSLLAHGHLATTDAPAAFTMALASWTFWRWTERPSAVRALMIALALGLAVSTRLTAWLLVPALALVALRGPVRAVARRQWLALAAVLAAGVPAVIWATHGFRSAPWPGASVSRPVAPRLGVPGRTVAALQGAGALPQAYLEGVRYQLEHGREGHPAYLLGERSKTGWWHYYAVAFAVKNTPGFLLAAAVAAWGLWRRRPGRGAVEAHWIVPAALVFLAASATRIQIGERYILSMYPYVILLAAAAVPDLLRTRRGRALAGAVLALHAGPALLAARGGYLSYFNLLAGGREGGHRALLDSNLDWGQDLPRLAEWMRAQGVARVQLAYHGADHPARHGIARADLPGRHSYPAESATGPPPAVLAVSPNLLFGLIPVGQELYTSLRDRPPDDRAGVFFVYRLR